MNVGALHVGRVPIDPLTFEQAIDAVGDLVAAKQGGTVFTPNVDHVVLAERNEAFREAYEAASLRLADGMPVVWASRAMGRRLPEKISGSDFVPALLGRASEEKWRVYLLGGASGSAERAAEVLRERGVEVVGVAAPRIDLDDRAGWSAIIDDVKRAQPQLVLLGLGAPKQELFARAAAERLAPAVLLGVGATIDFLAGKVPRAPTWMSRAGLEWAYRLAREPKRLWRRYLLRDPAFARVLVRDLRGTGVGRKLAVNVRALATAPVHLRACNEVGARPRTRGRPVIENMGWIRLGDDVQLNCAFSPVRLHAASGARLSIGDGVNVNFGAQIAAAESVSIGARVSIGPHVTIADRPGAGVTIEDDVWLAARVRVGPGVTIGAGTVVSAGSVVQVSLPAGVMAGGAPARVLRSKQVRKQEPSLSPEVRGTVVADFTAQDLAHALCAADPLGPAIEARVAPYDQVMQTLATPVDEDFVFVWSRPERISPSFARLLEGEGADEQAILADVDVFAAAVLGSKARTKLVATWTLPTHVRGLGMLDMRPGGVARTLTAMNLRLATALESSPGAFVLDASRWTAPASYSSRLWYLGKVGFTREVFESAARDVRAALRGIRGQARKLLVLDLDDTLWGGIVGDVGWQNLRLGGHDAVGEALVDFQRNILALSKRGIALAVVSKNDEAVALEAMRSHPEMLIKPHHLAAYRINWNDKARNVHEIAAELNVGLQSVVFVDDNPLERARVREALPEVFVPEWPDDKTRYIEALAGLRCFDVPHVSQEDQNRVALFAQEREREEIRQHVGSLDEWLDRLGTVVRITPLGASNIARTAQLLNKTNQMNLRTRRMNDAELLAWASDEAHEVWVAHVSDRLGDAGLTGILGLDVSDGAATVSDFVLSCRVMGRRVEETLLWFAAERARTRGARELVAPYVASPKNAPCRLFFESLAHFARQGDAFTCQALGFERPRGVEIVVEARS